MQWEKICQELNLFFPYIYIYSLFNEIYIFFDLNILKRCKSNYRNTDPFKVIGKIMISHGVSP